MSDDNDWNVFVDRLDFPPLTLEQRAAAIAEELRKGHPSELFCWMLAGMIHHPQGKNSTQFSLRLMHKNGGRPKADKRVAHRMQQLVDQDGLSVDAAIFEIQREFGEKGHSRSKCLAALAVGREWRALVHAFDEWTESDRRKQRPE